MKKIGEYTARGQIDDNTVEKITLFDGKFDTGYRITKFVVAGVDTTSQTTTDVNGCIGTTESGPSGSWDFGNNEQIAWSASRGIDAATLGDLFSLVDRDNMVIEDLYVYGNSNGGTKVNYYIEMDKYDITDWQGALTMVRNRSQA